ARHERHPRTSPGNGGGGGIISKQRLFRAIGQVDPIGRRRPSLGQRKLSAGLLRKGLEECVSGAKLQEAVIKLVVQRRLL
ncbi:hypothetical protein OESDEN_11607, partial [Oesophagostomum dentatum]